MGKSNALNIASMGLVAAQKRSILPGTEYNHMFPDPEREDPIVHHSMDVYRTLEIMADVVQKHKGETQAISAHLQNPDKHLYAKNLWDFVYTHIQYELDKNGVEQLRTPARTWADRKEGVDCDCMSIFISSALTNAGIPHLFRITKYGRPNWQHVYVVIPHNDQEIIMDTVMDSFNAEKPYSQKLDFHPITGKPLKKGLTGLNELTDSLNPSKSQAMINWIKANPITTAAIGVIAASVGYVTYDTLKKKPGTVGSTVRRATTRRRKTAKKLK